MILDACCLLLLILAVFKGVTKGFIRALLAFFAIGIGWMVATHFSGSLSKYLLAHGMTNSKWLPVLCFGAVLLATFILIHFLGKAIDKLTEMMMMGWLNKLAGILLYAIIYGMLFSSLLFFLQKMQILTPENTKDSIAYPYLSKWAPKILEKASEIVPFLKNTAQELNEFFENSSSK
jgi:membrane protein required for colicin V production